MLASTMVSSRQQALEKMKLVPQLGGLVSSAGNPEVENLLQRLVKERWRRLPSLLEDPLAILFDGQTHQWTAGWDPENYDLYLLVWEMPAWQEKPCWSFYRNGDLLLQETDGASRSRSVLLHKLLESEQLPFMNPEQFLEPLTSYRHTSVERDLSARKLLATMLARPEIFGSLKEPLFQALETELTQDEWPLLDVLKIHRVAHKNNLVRVFRDLVQANLLNALRDNARLDRALSLLHDEYSYLGYKISLLFRPSLEQSFDEFRRIISDGDWRTRLRLKPPEPTPAPGITPVQDPFFPRPQVPVTAGGWIPDFSPPR